MGPFPGSSLGSTGSVCLVPGGVRESMAPEPEALDMFLENLGSFLWMRVLLPSGSLPPEVSLGLGGGRGSLFGSRDSPHALLLDTQKLMCMGLGD